MTIRSMATIAGLASSLMLMSIGNPAQATCVDPIKPDGTHGSDWPQCLNDNYHKGGDKDTNNGAAVGLAIGSILLQGMQKSDEDIRDDVQRELNENHRRYQQEMKDAARRASAAEFSAQGADGTNPWGKPPMTKSQEKNPDAKATRRSVDCDDLQQYVESYIPPNVKDRPAQLKERWESAREDIPRYMSCKQSYDIYHSFDEKTQETDTASAASSAPSQKNSKRTTELKPKKSGGSGGYTCSPVDKNGNKCAVCKNIRESWSQLDCENRCDYNISVNYCYIDKNKPIQCRTDSLRPNKKTKAFGQYFLSREFTEWSFLCK